MNIILTILFAASIISTTLDVFLCRRVLRRLRAVEARNALLLEGQMELVKAGNYHHDVVVAIHALLHRKGICECPTTAGAAPTTEPN